MIATLVHDEIVSYTLRLYNELGITDNKYPSKRTTQL